MEYTALQQMERLVRSMLATHTRLLARSSSPSLALPTIHPYTALTRLSRLDLRRMSSINSSEYDSGARGL